MKTIPLFIFEEHHEAFFIWNYAVLNKLINSLNNLLLHVDEHSDMSVPKFSYSITSINQKLKDIYEFTYNELSIANFIIPAIYKGIFSQVYWLYQSNNEGKGSKKTILVYSHKGDGKVLMIDVNCDVGALALFNTDLKSALFKSLKSQDEFSPIQSVVLDIDLDYFSCNPPHYYYSGKLEVTKNEYDSLNRNKHHFLRLHFGSGIKSIVEDGKYYLLFNSSHPELIPNKLKVSEEEIITRIDLFVQFLKKNNVQPQLIDICRSRMSGFTPEEQWEFIEEKLLEKLSTLYKLDINHISAVFAHEKIANFK